MTVVANCPKCGVPIKETHSYSWCAECGEPLPSEIRDRLPQLVPKPATNDGGTVVEGTAGVGPNARVVNRYRDAYRVGAALVGLGDAFKVIGAVLGALMLLGALRAGGAFILVGVAMAVLIGALLWVCGVVVSAQGQILRATLDTAVSASPFLSDAQRGYAMGLSGTLVSQRGA